MKAIIKRHLLNDIPNQGEYTIDSDKAEIAKKEELKRLLSPEELAADVLEQAKITAEKIIDDARNKADEIISEAHQRGYEAGYAESADLRAEYERLIETLESEVTTQIEEGWAALEQELLKLSVEIAGKIIQYKISEDNDFVMKTIKLGLYQLRERHDLKIRVNPADYVLLREHKDDIMSACDGVRNLELIEDRRIERGGCIIETAGGQLDARIGTQLTEVQKALTEAAHDGREQIAA